MYLMKISGSTIKLTKIRRESRMSNDIPKRNKPRMWLLYFNANSAVFVLSRWGNGCSFVIKCKRFTSYAADLLLAIAWTLLPHLIVQSERYWNRETLRWRLHEWRGATDIAAALGCCIVSGVAYWWIPHERAAVMSIPRWKWRWQGYEKLKSCAGKINIGEWNVKRRAWRS